MKIPIGENEKGAICPIDKKKAFFYTLDSAYYHNYMQYHYPNALICTYAEFKREYPVNIFNNYHQKL